MAGRSLTNRLVSLIAGVTSVSVSMVVVALTWASYRISPEAIAGDTAIASALFGFTAVVLASLVAWRLGRGLSKPVVVMARTMRRMADGDLEVKTPPTHAATELDDMALALETFRTTARERLEAEAGRRAAEKTAQDRSDFLAVMSHELRTPMNGVLGMADALERTPLSDEQRQKLSVLTASGDALLALLNDVLDYSKIESGRCEFERVVFDLPQLVSETAALFATEADSKGLALSIQVAEGPSFFTGDPARIRQVLRNLLSNAVKFTPAGRIDVSVQSQLGADGACDILVAVEDTGIGIAPEIEDRLFEKFMQGDASTTRAYGGTGLGLAISRELARLMAGDVTSIRRDGVGARFEFHLRLAVAEAPSEHLSASEPGGLGSPDHEGPRLRILAAEDNANNRQVLALTLEMLGAETSFACDGAEAVEQWRAGAFDLILMDIQMPVMDGLTATRAIREGERVEGRAPAPIIAVTANAMAHHVEECLGAGMDAHVAKPVRAAELFAAMERVLNASPDGVAEEERRAA